jgi:uncharacterized membrane protein YfcA
MLGAALVVAAAAFTLSASAGLGGSLLLVPAMAILFGAKGGVAIAAVLLACNNVAKAVAYRRTIPFADAALVLILTVAGSMLGAGLLVSAPESVVQAVVAAGIVIALATERFANRRVRRRTAPVLAFAAGATSGFSALPARSRGSPSAGSILIASGSSVRRRSCRSRAMRRRSRSSAPLRPSPRRGGGLRHSRSR